MFYGCVYSEAHSRCRMIENGAHCSENQTAKIALRNGILWWPTPSSTKWNIKKKYSTHAPSHRNGMERGESRTYASTHSLTIAWTLWVTECDMCNVLHNNRLTTRIDMEAMKKKKRQKKCKKKQEEEWTEAVNCKWREREGERRQKYNVFYLMFCFLLANVFRSVRCCRSNGSNVYDAVCCCTVKVL